MIARPQNITVTHCVTRSGALVELEVSAQIAGSLDILAIVDTETGAAWTGTLTAREESRLRDRLCVAASEADDDAREAARERMVQS